MKLESNELNLIWLQDGENGIAGDSSYIWVKYSTKETIEEIQTEQDITDDPDGAIFIGIAYGQEQQLESTDPSKYKWSKIKGETGQEGADAYTIVLDNENVSFLADGEGIATYDQSYDCNIVVYKGIEVFTNFTILKNEVVAPVGITLNISDKKISISVKKGRFVKGNHGSIDIPISIDGLTFIKTLTYTINKNGADESYTWIAYADNARPLSSEMFDTPEGMKYIGISPNHTSPERSGVFTDYEWFPLNNVGDYASSIEKIYHKSIYDTANNIPAPNNDAYALAVQQGVLNVEQGSLATGLSPWTTDKPEYSAGNYLWTALKVVLSDGSIIYTSPVKSDEWDKHNAKIGGAQLIRNSKTLIDSRIYWF